MTWIFEQCTDPYGHCIRQYCVMALTFLTFCLCSYSVYQTLRKKDYFKFQLIPLIINTIATFVLLCAISQFEQESIYLIMELIQIYSYSLMTYSYAGLYLLGTMRISREQFRKFRIIFITFSVIVVAGIILLIVLQVIGKIKCNQSHGLGNLILFLCQLPICLITFIFTIKTKRKIKYFQDYNKNEEDKGQVQLLGNQDQYIKIRYLQANLVIFFLALSILFHVATIAMFFTEKTRCSEDYVQTENIYEVIMFSIFDITALLPHVGVPIMLYFIPAWHFVRGDTILIIPYNISKNISQVGQSNLIGSEFQSQSLNKMRKKYKG